MLFKLWYEVVHVLPRRIAVELCMSESIMCVGNDSQAQQL